MTPLGWMQAVFGQVALQQALVTNHGGEMKMDALLIVLEAAAKLAWGTFQAEASFSGFAMSASRCPLVVMAISRGWPSGVLNCATS